MITRNSNLYFLENGSVSYVVGNMSDRTKGGFLDTQLRMPGKHCIVSLPWLFTCNMLLIGRGIVTWQQSRRRRTGRIDQTEPASRYNTQDNSPDYHQPHLLDHFRRKEDPSLDPILLKWRTVGPTEKNTLAVMICFCYGTRHLVWYLNGRWTAIDVPCFSRIL